MVADAGAEDQAEALAILGHERHARLQHLLRRHARGELLPEQTHLAALALTPGAEQVHQELAAPGAHQPADAEHLASAHLEAQVFEEGRRTLPRGHGQVLHLELHVAGGDGAAREQIGDLAANHVPDHLFLVGLLGVERDDALPVAQHGDPIGDREHLVEFVRDVDAGNAAFAVAPDQLEQRDHFLIGERGGRLVQDQDLALLADGSGDLDQLPLPDAQLADRCHGIELDLRLREDLLRALVERVPVDEAAALRRVAEQQVLGDRHFRDEREFLVDDGDARSARVARSQELGGAALSQDLTS